jgi:uncharacterized integral membrane protein (TIGR00698 family)
VSTLTKQFRLSHLFFFLAIALSLLPSIGAPVALVIGIVFTNVFSNPYPKQSSSLVKKFLQIAIVGLGFGMNIDNAIQAGKEGLLFTILTLILVFFIGWVLYRVFGLHRKISYLIASGTAICGGSAIAAVAPLIQAKEKHISIAIGTVFILNAVALLIFPLIGNALEMSQHQFGLWSAIAIHDTSSVVGAAAQYGEEALEVATTVKLGRALWIIPLSLFTAFIFRTSGKGIKIPYFILYFILAMVIASYTPQFAEFYSWVSYLSKRLLVVTLLLVGMGLTAETIKKAGLKSMLFGISLWVAISVASLLVILFYVL